MVSAWVGRAEGGGGGGGGGCDGLARKPPSGVGAPVKRTINCPGSNVRVKSAIGGSLTVGFESSASMGAGLLDAVLGLDGEEDFWHRGELTAMIAGIEMVGWGCWGGRER